MPAMTFAPDLVRTDRGTFGLPRGLSGRLAGRLMAANHEQQQELAQLVELPEQGSLCEVGYGPGVLLHLLRTRFPHATLCGADPSALMLRHALRTTAADPGDRVTDLRTGAVADLPFDDDTFNVTVSINTVQFWPDLRTGLREIRRVTRPGGQVLIAWHGGTEPRRFQRRLILNESELTHIASTIEEHLGEVHRTRLAQSELFTAALSAEPAA